MSRARVLDVGQCGYDHGQIARSLGKHFGAEVVASSTQAEALAKLGAETFDLVLVNRVGDEDGAAGLDLIRELKSRPETASIPAMLVSNYAEAQAEAVALGALPGFGKADLQRGRPPAGLVTALGPRE